MSATWYKLAKVLTFWGKVLWLLQFAELSLMQGYALEPSSPFGISSQSEWVKRSLIIGVGPAGKSRAPYLLLL
jgi:hypothetical protein